MRVALYLRRSTVDLQPDSLDAQEERLRKYAADHDHAVVDVFADSSSGRSVRGRDAFQKLMDRVRAKPDFEAVLVRDVSRWSRAENLDEAGYYEFVCRSNGVQVIYADESLAPDGSPYNVLLKSVRRAMAAEFSREKAKTVRFAALRLVRQGLWPTGSVPYGYRRVLVSPSGEFIRDLKPGDRKALASERVKLALGDSKKVDVVRRMFEEYAVGDRSLVEISNGLNADHVPSSTGSIWTSSMVSYCLQNEAYVGNLVYRIRDGRKPSEQLSRRGTAEEVVARCEAAHPAIVSKDLWKTVQNLLASRRSRRTDVELVEELRAARKLWSPGKRAPREVVTGADFRVGYGRPGRRDADVVGDAIELAMKELRQKLSASLVVTPFEKGFLLDGLLYIGVKASLPHARFGGLQWRFEFDDAENFDAVIGLAFSPPPRIEHVETFVFRTSGRSNAHRAVSLPLIGAAGNRQYSRHSVDDNLEPTLRYLFRFRGTRAEALLLDAMKGMEAVSLTEVAERLGWPVEATRVLYRKLDVRGEPIPPLKNGFTGKRLTVVCPHCLRKRTLSPKTVLALRTDVCFECLHREPPRTSNRFVVECPACGKRRLHPPSVVASLSDGTATLCRTCSTKRNLGAEVRASRERGRRP